MMEPDWVTPTYAESGNLPIAELRDRHRGQTAWIVGKGPSLLNLRADDLGPGFIITLNESIAIIQDFDLHQPIYAMQKDGCSTIDVNFSRPCSTCYAHGWKREPLIDPWLDVTAIFSQRLSPWCLHGRPNRYTYMPGELGFDNPRTMSVLESIPFAQFLGASSIVMCCFDYLVNGSTVTVAPGRPVLTEGERAENGVIVEYGAEAQAGLDFALAWSKPIVMRLLSSVPHRFLIPQDRDV